MNQPNTINQHYVPEFCFKLFFQEESFCYLSVPQAPNERILFSNKARKKRQSSEDYFYGKDQTLEKKYADLENDTAILINSFLDNDELLSEEQFNLLCRFAFSQAIRTKKFFERYIGIKSNFAREINATFVYNRELLLLDFYFAAVAYAPILNLGLTASFIVNNTSNGLLFSDNPVQVYNSFFPYSHGLGMAGLVIVFPIHSYGFVVIYDEKMFNLNSTQMTTEDVKVYNKMLIANCGEKVYFQDAVNQQYFRELIEETMEYRNATYFNTLGPQDSKVAFLNFPQTNTQPVFSFLSLKEPYIDLGFEEKTEFPRFRCEQWKWRYNINPKILAQTGLEQYNWSKMNDIVDLYWGKQDEILSVITDEFDKQDLGMKEAIKFLFYGIEMVQIRKTDGARLEK